ncbi:hypothetical protein [Nocardioides lianchengensis]|uniref:Uncharacterized protein n=1 Tax=Nocardioides lianchengensis TaxID=1045774 RepID=A0A1G6VB96_9ACTN|nr:hypothetical protein [Nocardioides lianchengensis]NYG11217.1 hypothetical protein [Nocardioides lianchengensis]SDD50862.1 hypothetical protein SAMN05421872_108269 [Nocardioides lianchengensis]
MNGMQHRFVVSCVTVVVGAAVVGVAYVATADTGLVEVFVAAGLTGAALVAIWLYVRALRRG